MMIKCVFCACSVKQVHSVRMQVLVTYLAKK